MRNRTRLAVLLLAPACLLIAGCVEATLAYTLNPDGSGKVKIDAVLPALGGFGEFVSVTNGEESEAEQRQPEAAVQLDEMLRDTVQELLSKSEGVTAWKDVSAEFRDDGKIHFVGTAYFDDISKVQFDPIMTDSAKLIRSDDGALTLKLADDGDSDNQDGQDPKVDPRKMSDAELEKHMLLWRARYQQTKGMMTAVLSGLDIKSAYRLPGRIQDVEGFQREGANTVSARIEGKQVLKAAEQFMTQDKEWLRKQMQQEARIGQLPAEEQFKNFGLILNEAKATVPAPKGPQFDYAKELAGARKEYEKLKKKFDLERKDKSPTIELRSKKSSPPEPTRPRKIPDEKD